MKYRLTSHALEKFKDLERYGFRLTKRQIVEIIRDPDAVERGGRGRKIAQKGISERHVLRVIYTEKEGLVEIITLLSREEGSV